MNCSSANLNMVKGVTRCLATLALISLLGLLSPVTAGCAELVISQVRASTAAMQESSFEPVRLAFTLSQAATVNINLFDSRNHCIRRLLDKQSLNAGQHEAVWDGKDSQGRPVPANYYLYTIEATATGQETTVFDPGDMTGGALLSPQNLVYDQAAQQVRFLLLKPALVNIRVGLNQGGPLVATLVDWLPLPAGEHAIPWDGRDASGILKATELKGLEIGGSGYELPLNTLVVTPVRPDQKRPGFIALLQATWPDRVAKEPKIRQMLNHWQHRRDACYDPAMRLELPDTVKRDNQGRVLADAPLAVTVEIAEADRRYMLDQRFEIVYYVDFLFQGEEELGYTPYQWHWDPKGMAPGEHYLTVMLRGFDGHFATASLKVWVP